MSFLSTIINELRDKRLWPLAAGLVVAIVAVPLLLTSKPATVSQTPAGGATAPRGSALPAVNVVATAAHSRLRGRARDPFSLQAAARAANNTAASSSPTSATGAAAAGGTATGAAPSGSGAGSGTTTTPSTSTTTSGPGESVRYFFYATDLAFGKAGTSLRTYRSAPRLTALPSATTPIAVFLGVKDGGKAAVFMVWSLASLSGSGRCMPSRTECFFLELRPGQRETMNAPNAQGVPSKFTLRVAAIHLRSTSSLAQARAANARVSSAGSKFLAAVRKARPWLSALSYSVSTGLVTLPVDWRTWVAHIAQGR